MDLSAVQGIYMNGFIAGLGLGFIVYILSWGISAGIKFIKNMV